MKQHMMTHKLRDMPQHMFGTNTMDQNSRSPDHPKESASLRVKSESELSPRSTENNRNSSRDRERERERERERFDRREPLLSSQFQSQIDNSYQMMLERHQQLQIQQQSSRQSPLHLSHFQRQQSMAMSPPQSTAHAQPSPQHIKSDETRQKPSSLDIDQPSAKRQLCKFFLSFFFFSLFFVFFIFIFV